MKLELVLIPSTGDGHLRPLVEVAKLLLDNDDHLSITVIIIPSMHGFQTTSYSSYIASLSTTSNDRLRFSFISSADRPNSPDAEPNFISYMESYKPVVKATVAKLTDYAQPPSSRLAGFVMDIFCTTMIDVANDFGVPTYLFYPSNATFFGLQIHVQYLSDVEKCDIISELKDSETELEVPCLTRSLPAKCPICVVKQGVVTCFLRQARRFRETKGFLVNTFAELEPQAMSFLSNGDNNLPTVYAVGPVLSVKTTILRWLDDQPDRSVVFLCFGSMGGFSEDQAKEIAIALERSSHRFIWCLRRATPMGPPEEFTNLEEILPEGFLDRTSEIGKIIGWAPQRAVLASPAIGGFVSHCGWNSILESLWFGFPLPLRCLMEKDSDVRDRVRKMSEKSHMAVMDGLDLQTK
ncbi:hypothetical protein Bca52824_086581 [Brassica carinata]|uniref:Glycosyltransferase n=1 Tax=Brassica carinata TaxID=52824 RepID=A0A8X7PAH4_BRACI|nr:hypothetical protein Bca52824_086581 [Brassica carinata]